MKEKSKKTQGKKTTSRQIVAIFCVILLVLLYVITLISAIADSSSSATWFRICLFGTFAIPLIAWIYSWMYGRLTGKPAIGDPEPVTFDEPETDSDPSAAAADPDSRKPV